MSTKVTLCNDKGESLCGTDGHLQIDGRFGLYRLIQACWDYRTRFQKNFKGKYDYWTHVKIERTGNIIKLF